MQQQHLMSKIYLNTRGSLKSILYLYWRCVKVYSGKSLESILLVAGEQSILTVAGEQSILVVNRRSLVSETHTVLPPYHKEHTCLIINTAHLTGTQANKITKA